VQHELSSTMNESALPKVSALMGAYNYGRYIGEAIESAMNQEYPPELLELIIVDDGSTDDTVAIVEPYLKRYGERIKFVQQANGGATASTNRARREASGELIALLDADDVWLSDKTRLQVKLLQDRPDLGLVFSRMTIVDANGTALSRDYGHKEPIAVNAFARQLWENVAVQSSLMIKAELFDQIPSEIPYADWWLGLVATKHHNIEYLRHELVLYRWHGANITGGVGGLKSLREGQKGIHLQRWVLRNFELDFLMSKLSPAEMQYVWAGLEHEAQKGLAGIASYFAELAPVSDEDRAQAAQNAAAAAQAQEDGDLLRACALLLRARACDPYDLDLHERFGEAVTAATAALALPDPMEGSGSFAVLVDASFLLSDIAHLKAYAEAMRGASGATLVIDASAIDPGKASAELPRLVQQAGLADDDQVPMIAIVGELEPSQRFRVRQATRAVYAQAADQAGEVPVFSPGSLRALRTLAESAA